MAKPEVSKNDFSTGKSLQIYKGGYQTGSKSMLVIPASEVARQLFKKRNRQIRTRKYWYIHRFCLEDLQDDIRFAFVYDLPDRYREAPDLLRSIQEDISNFLASNRDEKVFKMR